MSDVAKTNKSVKHTANRRNAISSFMINAILIVFSVTCIYPVFWMFYSSFKTTREFNNNPVGLPAALHFDNYVQVVTKTLMPAYIKNSAVVTVISLFFILVFGFIAGYFLSRYRFKGRNMLYAYYMVGMLIPIHALLVPIYILTKNIGLINTVSGLVLPYVSFGLPTAVFLIESYVRTVPKEIEEAANIDGSSFSRTLIQIILPMCKPIMVTVAIIQFFTCWNEFSFALILLSEQAKFTVPLGLTLFRGPYATNYPMIMTATVISITPVMILYFSFSGNIIKGMTAGAVKG